MFSRRDLEKLLQAHSNPILSVYVNTDPARDPKASYRIWLKDALKDLETDIESAGLRPFRESAEHVTNYIREHRPQGKSWVGFVNEELFETFNLRVPVENEVQWGRPEVTQLEWLLEEFRPYGVVLVDSERVRLFLVAMNEIRELDEQVLGIDTSSWRKKDMMPPSQAQGTPVRGAVGGGSHRDAYSERRKVQVERFWREASKGLRQLKELHGVRQAVLGGPKTARDGFLQILGADAEMVIGQISTRTGAPGAEVLEESLPVIQSYERDREAPIVQELLRRASTSAQANVGLPATLKALQEGRVETVVVNRRLDKTVKECSDCGYVLEKDRAECPHCGSTQLQEVSLRAMLPVLLRRHGATMEIVREQAADELEPHGGIGALWRY